MKRIFVFGVVLIVVTVGFALCDTHYVSKVGSDTYPYTTWETAADSISKVMGAADLGDTVRVGVGTYYEHVVMKAGIVLIGAGRDSCVIDIHGSLERDVIIAADSMLVEGFHIIGKVEIDDACIGIRDAEGGPIEDLLVKNNLVSNCHYGVFLANWTDTMVVQELINNVFLDSDKGIRIDNEGTTIIADNQFFDNEQAMYGRFGRPLVVNNEIRNTGNRAVYWSEARGGAIANNLITKTKDYEGLAIGSAKKLRVENNTISDGEGCGLWFGGEGCIARNNIITSNGWEGVMGSSDLVYVYNNVWGNLRGNDIVADSVEGNISEDPMFVGNDDYHLQHASPCIDTGDPAVFDVDDTRSDMGVYGGPGGESYEYLDLAPGQPESDLTYYTVYRDTGSGFIPRLENQIGSTDSSRYVDYDIEAEAAYFYRVSAWDSTGHESDYSDEVMAVTTDIDGPFPDGQVPPTAFRLFQNYPNPFNSFTDIRYQIPDVRSPVRPTLKIYNLLGQEVRTLVDEPQEAGYYTVTWDASDMASGVYFYRLTADQFTATRRMVLMK